MENSFIEQIKSEVKDNMNRSIEILERDLRGLRAGRASADFLNPVMVDAYPGSRSKLIELANISTLDSRTINIQVWDKSIMKNVEKAIADSNLGVNPVCEGDLIRISMPSLTQERRQEMAKLASSYGEKCKISIRGARRQAMDSLKTQEKNHEITEDESKQISKIVQQITDDSTAKADSLVSNKTQEITSL